MKFLLKSSMVLLIFLARNQGYSQPKLVVGIVVDQMRYDYLERFGSRFCDSGFKLLMNEGFNYVNAHFNYIPTYTAPGHASIFTGTTPSLHGIIANDWYSREKGRRIYCTDDPEVKVIGGKGYGNSPKNMVSSTITDQLALSTQFKSKIIGISIKDRSAILPAGHAATGAYWYDSKSGKMISTSWYGYELPTWLTNFNKQGNALKYLDQTWNTLYPIQSYSASAPDDNRYENSLKKGGKPVFPYNLKEIQADRGYGLLNYTPFSNSLLVDAAIAAVIGEELGKDSITDFLSISFSGPDYAGHFFGPQAIEIEDIYLRLDLELARLIHALDKQLGKGNYTLFLSSDHGGNEVPALLNDNGIVAGLLKEDSLKKTVSNALLERFKDSLVLNVVNEQVYLDHERIRKAGLYLPAVIDEVCQILSKESGIYAAYSYQQIMNSSDPYLVKLYNGYYPQRSGDVLIRTMPGWMDYEDKGTTHGSGYNYDTRAPLLFYGYGVQKGKSSREVNITDIAPSLSLIMRIQFPNACTGKPLQEMLGY